MGEEKKSSHRALRMSLVFSRCRKANWARMRKSHQANKETYRKHEGNIRHSDPDSRKYHLHARNNGKTKQQYIGGKKAKS